jgi:hypothetical protein
MDKVERNGLHRFDEETIVIDDVLPDSCVTVVF